MKYHRPDGLNNGNLFYHSSEGRVSNIKVSASFISSEASLLGLQMATSCILSSVGAYPWSIFVFEYPFLIRTLAELD